METLRKGSSNAGRPEQQGAPRMLVTGDIA